MLSRRSVLAAFGIFAWMGCKKNPPSPPATAFLKNIQVMDRDGNVLADEWIVSHTHPIEPTIQFETVAPPAVLAGRKVTPADEWIITAHLCDESGQVVPSVGVFQSDKLYGEETIGDQMGKLVWESPDSPQALLKGVAWQWCHFRVPEPGRYTLILMFFPTPIRIAMDPNIDYGEGIEIARQALIIEPGPIPAQSLMTSGGLASSRSIHRRMRPKFK